MLVRDPLFIAVIMKVITGANLFHGSASKKNKKKKPCTLLSYQRNILGHAVVGKQSILVTVTPHQ